MERMSRKIRHGAPVQLPERGRRRGADRGVGVADEGADRTREGGGLRRGKLERGGTCGAEKRGDAAARLVVRRADHGEKHRARSCGRRGGGKSWTCPCNGGESPERGRTLRRRCGD